MFPTVWSPILHGFLYLLAASLLFLIVSPASLARQRWREFQFSGIAIVTAALYLGLEFAQPEVYALFMLPVVWTATLLHNKRTSTVINFIFLAGIGIYELKGDWIAIMASCLFAFAVSCLFHRNYPIQSKWRLSLFSISMSAVYLIVYMQMDYYFYGKKLPLDLHIWLVWSTLLASQSITFVYFFIKNQLRLQRDLVLSEKYQSVAQLAASISHEIRNPLTTTRGFLQLMNVDKLSKENFERYRKYAFEGLDHANNIITDYLNFSKPSIETPRALNVKEELESVVLWLQPFSAQKNVSIVTHHLSHEALYIHAQPKQFQQCMLNIMKNAIESMADGGLLTVHSRLEQGQIQILIRDTGIGMSSEQLKQIGTPYFSMKDKGTGLGLMVVMNLVKAMDGKIFFRSKLNQGTICELHFHRVDASEIKDKETADKKDWNEESKPAAPSGLTGTTNSN